MNYFLYSQHVAASFFGCPMLCHPLQLELSNIIACVDKKAVKEPVSWCDVASWLFAQPVRGKAEITNVPARFCKTLEPAGTLELQLVPGFSTLFMLPLESIHSLYTAGILESWGLLWRCDSWFGPRCAGN